MPPQTKCNKCKFKKIDDNEVQIDCLADVKTKILDQYPEIYSENSFNIVDNAWVIDDFLCPIARPGQISNNVEDVNEAYEQNKIRLYLIYFMDSDIVQLEKNLAILKESFVKPSYISIILQPQFNYLSNSIIELLQKYNICTWKVHSFVEEFTYCEYVDNVLSTNAKNNNTTCYSIWDNSPIPELYYNTINDALSFLSAKNPIIQPIKTEPYHVGCVVPFSTYFHSDFSKCHGLIVYHLFDNPSHNRLVISLL